MYLVGILVIGVIGAVVQYKYFYETEEEKLQREKEEKEMDKTKEHGDATQSLLDTPKA